MTIKNHLFWEKWRPRKLEDTILLPRIRKYVDRELSRNYLLFGPPGCGKSTVAKIITKEYPSITFNASFYSSVDTLRNEIERFCRTMPTMFGEDEKKYTTKVVYLDEFDGVSNAYQEAMRGFVEQYESSVRFILTVNSLSKITPAMRSRFTLLDFTINDRKEESYLLTHFYKRLTEIILPTENFKIEDADLKKLMVRNFPDFRYVLEQIGAMIEMGETSTDFITISSASKEKLYSIVTTSSTSDEDIYNFLMEAFGNDKIDELLKLLGTSFIKWSIDKGIKVDKLGKISRIVSEHMHWYQTTMDPIVLGMSVIGCIRDIY